MSPPPVRADRGDDELRPVSLKRAVAPYAEGSCLISTGSTRVLCTATIQEFVPDWRRGAGLGWVTAEYSMLPRATQQRTRRERGQLRGRTQEIQRLIGRALRAAVDFDALGERTILLDCDVLVADGGTRTAAITGGAVALHDACAWLVEHGRVQHHAVRELVAATSMGIISGLQRLDLAYEEDVVAEVDLNLVALESGALVEVQGTGERGTFSQSELADLVRLGLGGIRELVDLQRRALGAS